MISAEEISILKDQPTLTWTDSLLKLSHPWLLHSDSMVPWTSTLLNSKPTWCHIHVSISCCHHMPQSSQLKRLIMNNSQLLKSPTQLSSQHQWWQSVTQDTVNTWLAVWCTEVMSSPRTLTLLLPPSRPRELSNSSTGAQLASSAVLTINHQLLFQVVTWPRLWEPSAWSLTQLLLLRYSQESITSSILCTPREPSYIGT